MESADAVDWITKSCWFNKQLISRTLALASKATAMCLSRSVYCTWGLELGLVEFMNMQVLHAK